MPELPDVESARRLLEGKCVGKRLRRVVATEQGGGPRDGLFDDIVFQGVSSAMEFEKKLTGRRFTRANRKGKYLWVELDGSGPHILIHFGMSGAIIVKGVVSSKYKSVKLPDGAAWPPKFCKCLFVFDDGTEAAFVNIRRLGRVRLLNDPAREPPVSELGFDALNDLPTPEGFAAMLSSRATPIKALLLDQTFCAGVGNWIADEVCYQARVHPTHPANELSAEGSQAILNALRFVVSCSTEDTVGNKSFRSDWLFHFRWSNKKSAHMPDGSLITFCSVGGRTTAVVEAVQGRTWRAKAYLKNLGSKQPVSERAAVAAINKATQAAPGAKRRRRQTAETSGLSPGVASSSPTPVKRARRRPAAR